MQNLSAGTAARQKELEQLKKMEEAALQAKQQEQAEIERREQGLRTLDQQIAEVKGRLGTAAARSDDNLDQILALVEQKEEQGKRLETLRQQREAAERDRQQEIERLKKEALQTKISLIEIDLAKYSKVASSKYANDMKDSAWAAMVANYPQAKETTVGDIDGFLRTLGLTSYNGKVMTLEEGSKKQIEEKVRQDQETEEEQVRVKDREIAKLTYSDPHTGLMWAMEVDRKFNWKDADTFCKNYRLGGFADWRMPTLEELMTLYKSQIIQKKYAERGLVVWAADSYRLQILSNFFDFRNGHSHMEQNYGIKSRLIVLPVRSYSSHTPSPGR